MIKMTKVGVKPQEEKFEGKCTRCGSEFECARADLKYCADPRDPYAYISCTLCKGTVVMGQARPARPS